MPGLNTTGLPTTTDYNLGRGALYFASLDANKKPLGFRHLGNASAFAINLESESLEHQSSRSGLRLVDKEVLISQKAGISMTLEEINFQNIALFLSGETDTSDATAASISVANLAHASVSRGFWYDILDDNGDRAYDIDGTFSVSYDDDSAGTGKLTLNASYYTLDATMGRVFLKVDGGSPITDGASGLYFSLADNTTTALDKVKGLTKTSVAGALKFISKNPANNDAQTEYKFHSVTLKAEGDFSLIGDEFTEMQLTGTAESASDAYADSPVVTITTHANA